MSIILLISFILIAWLMHAAVASLYSKRMANTKDLPFRILHTFEISVIVTGTLVLFDYVVEHRISPLLGLAVILGTLILIDGIALLVAKQLRKRFDSLHFLSAYTAVSLISWIIFSY